MSSLSNHPGAWAGGVILGETYLLGRRLSAGGMGEVFEATHARLPGRYAVKVLRPELLGNREAFGRFCREAEVMSELRHPNVVQIYDFNTTPDGRPYFVMELLEGRDLETRLTKEGPVPLPGAVRVVESVASALATAHAHGIIHRDLKPANIFLCTIDGQMDELVKVLDFGISKIRSSGTLLSTPTDMLGSPAYMSPEQARGAAEELDGRSDQFALGAIAFRMLTGWDPFQGDDIASLLYQVVHEPPPPLTRYLPAWWDTRALQAVLDRALAKDPAQRWTGMMELARAFEAASEQTLSHDPARRQTDRSAGTTLFATPPPPPLRPPLDAAPLTPEPALEIEDAPPPVRTPTPEVLRTPTPEVLRLVPKRPRTNLDLQGSGVAAPTGTRADADFDDPYLHDALPVTHHRLALALLGLLAIAAFLGVTGAYHRILWSARRQLGLGRPVPAASPPAAPASEVPAVRAPATPPAQQPAPPRAASPTPPAHAAQPSAATPARPKAVASERHHEAAPPRRHHRDDEPRMIKRPGSVYLTPSSPPPEPTPAGPARSAATKNPFAQPPGTTPPPNLGPDKVPDQFSIPPPAPTGDSPSRDLAPPPLPEAEPSSPGPRITPAPAPGPTPPPGPPPSAPPPTERAPADQPMPPSF
ncbi:MAG TPA: serine/threonine-protein kinase [Polyangia bacterium]